MTNSNNARWFALIDDRTIISPSKKITVSVLKELGGVDKESKLFLDNFSSDTILENNQEIDLSEGNVLYTNRKEQKENNNEKQAKLAFSVDDNFEIVAIKDISYNTFLHLFKLDKDEINLYRDYESPNDNKIEENSNISFKDGPYFYTKAKELKNCKIFINAREHNVLKKEISYEKVVSLACGKNNATTVYTITYSSGPNKNPSGDMVSGDIVKIKEGMVFNVTATTKS